MDPNLSSFIRMGLAALASFIIGKAFWGTPITTELADTGIAVALEVTALVWSLRDHSATIEKVQSGIRNFFAFAGGFMISRGIISAEQSVVVGGALVAAATYIYSRLSKKKSDMLASGDLEPRDLKTSR